MFEMFNCYTTDIQLQSSVSFPRWYGVLFKTIRSFFASKTPIMGFRCVHGCSNGGSSFSAVAWRLLNISILNHSGLESTGIDNVQSNDNLHGNVVESNVYLYFTCSVVKVSFPPNNYTIKNLISKDEPKCKVFSSQFALLLSIQGWTTMLLFFFHKANSLIRVSYQITLKSMGHSSG